MNKQDKIAIFIIIAVTIILVIGSTFAYFTWVSNTSQRTTVTFTSGAGFLCSANGGGNITSNDITLAPTTCTDTARAIKRTVTVGPTITQSDGDVYLDMWLKVNSIGSGLSASQNFKYALTTSGTSCTSGTIIAQGNFNRATTNTQKPLLIEKAYSQTTTDTYYLWIWLDSAETSPDTEGQSFNLELGGSCTNHLPYTYTANIYDENTQGYNAVWIGQTIPNTITEYTTPATAMAALKTAGGGTTDYPFFLRHTIGSETFWCEVNSTEGNSYCIYESQSECNANVSSGYVCQENTVTDGVTASYVGFVVTPAMATANPGMTAGTYYLKGGDFGRSFLANAKTIYDALGGINCYGDNNLPATYDPTYTPNPSSYFYCGVSGLDAGAHSYGNVYADDSAGSDCSVGIHGESTCWLED